MSPSQRDTILANNVFGLGFDRQRPGPEYPVTRNSSSASGGRCDLPHPSNLMHPMNFTQPFGHLRPPQRHVHPLAHPTHPPQSLMRRLPRAQSPVLRRCPDPAPLARCAPPAVRAVCAAWDYVYVGVSVGETAQAGGDQGGAESK